MAQISNLVKHRVNKQILQPIVYNCVDYREFDDIKDVLDPLFSKVVFKEVGLIGGAYVCVFKTMGVDSKEIEYELYRLKEEYDSRN